MKRHICFLLAFLLFISFCFTACSSGQNAASTAVSQTTSQPQAGSSSSQSLSEPALISSAAEDPEAELSQREKDWRADFAYFKRHYLMYHPDPFYYVSEEEFDWQIGQLVKKVDQLSDMDLYFEFAKIVAGLGDNHTSVHTPNDFNDRIFPVGAKYFGEKLYLCGYLKGYEQFEPYQLHEIVSINGVDIKYLQKKAESVLYPTNEWCSKDWFGEGFFNPCFFDWACRNTEAGYTVQLLDDNQRVVSLELPVIAYDPDTLVVVKPENWDKLPRLQETGVSFYETEKGNYVYLALIGATMYDRGIFYHELMQEVSSLLTEHPGSKLVVDLREHPGGDDRVVEDIKSDFPLLKESYEPKTYVLTGGGTMSASIHMLLVFKEEFGAVQAGEPTGQFTSLWGYSNPVTMTMPRSQISFNVATHFVENTSKNLFYDENGKLYEWENTVLPDVYVSQTIEDIKAGKDSVIEWVLEH